MRTIQFVTAAALLVASIEAHAQTPPTKPEPPAVPSLGELDFGYRGGSVKGDEARFERAAAYERLGPVAEARAGYERLDAPATRPDIRQAAARLGERFPLARQLRGNLGCHLAAAQRAHHRPGEQPIGDGRARSR